MFKFECLSSLSRSLVSCLVFGPCGHLHLWPPGWLVSPAPVTLDSLGFEEKLSHLRQMTPLTQRAPLLKSGRSQLYLPQTGALRTKQDKARNALGWSKNTCSGLAALWFPERESQLTSQAPAPSVAGWHLREEPEVISELLSFDPPIPYWALELPCWLFHPNLSSVSCHPLK